MQELKQKDFELNFIDNAKGLPFVASRFDYFEAHGDSERYFFFDGQEADIEPEELTHKGLIFKPVNFVQKTVSTEVLISQRLKNDTPIDVEAAAKTVIVPRKLRKLQSEAFGKGNVDGSENNMQDIFQYNLYEHKIADIKDEFATVADMYADFVEQAENLKGAYFVVDNALFALNVLDIDGSRLLKEDKNAKDGRIGTWFGLPVLVQNMNGKGKVVLLNETAYSVSHNKTFTANTIDGSEDSGLLKMGAIAVYGEIMASGMVVNPHAIRILKGELGGLSVDEPVEFATMSASVVEEAETEDEIEEVKATIVENVEVPKKKKQRKAKGE